MVSVARSCSAWTLQRLRQQQEEVDHQEEVSLLRAELEDRHNHHRRPLEIPEAEAEAGQSQFNDRTHLNQIRETERAAI